VAIRWLPMPPVWSDPESSNALRGRVLQIPLLAALAICRKQQAAGPLAARMEVICDEPLPLARDGSALALRFCGNCIGQRPCEHFWRWPSSRTSARGQSKWLFE